MSPFRDAIYMPELMDNSKWLDGFGGGFQDKEGQLIFGYNAVVTNPGHYNKARLPKADLTKMEDLLLPKNASRIVWHDPRSPGPGFATAMAIYFNYGEEFLTKLLKLQGPAYTNNRRQAAEFVVRGRYPIGLGTSRDFMVMFEKEGLTKNVEEFPDEWLKNPTMSSGNGNVVLIDKAPHPYAAKLYINWFLQQEQQQQWNKETDGASRRLDTKPNKPDLAPKPGKKYVDIFHENQIGDVAKVLKIARDTITAAPDKDDD
jgi:iron(III) transport system substrate-binding protein